MTRAKHSRATLKHALGVKDQSDVSPSSNEIKRLWSKSGAVFAFSRLGAKRFLEVVLSNISSEDL